MQLELLRTLNLKGSSAPLEELESSDARPASLDDARPPNRRQRRGLFPRRQVKKLAIENLAALTEAIELANRLTEEHGELPLLVLERSKSLARAAEIQFGLRELDSSKLAKQRALRDLVELCERNPNEPDYREALAETYSIPIGEDDTDNLRQLEKASELDRRIAKRFARQSELHTTKR